jgi:hypothetical protein
VLEFQAEAILCLENLKGETLSLMKDLMTIAPDLIKSEISVEPDLQFTNRIIKANVIFKDSAGVQLFTTIPSDIQNDIENLVKGEVSLGNISDFKYDGYGAFTANIESKIPGEGLLTVSYNNNILQRLLNTDNSTTSTTVEENSIPYTFIKRDLPIVELDDFNPAVRRDSTDVSGSGVINE